MVAVPGLPAAAPVAAAPGFDALLAGLVVAVTDARPIARMLPKIELPVIAVEEPPMQDALGPVAIALPQIIVPLVDCQPGVREALPENPDVEGRELPENEALASYADDQAPNISTVSLVAAVLSALPVIASPSSVRVSPLLGVAPSRSALLPSGSPPSPPPAPSSPAPNAPVSVIAEPLLQPSFPRRREPITPSSVGDVQSVQLPQPAAYAAQSPQALAEPGERLRSESVRSPKGTAAVQFAPVGETRLASPLPAAAVLPGSAVVPSPHALVSVEATANREIATPSPPVIEASRALATPTAIAVAPNPNLPGTGLRTAAPRLRLLRDEPVPVAVATPNSEALRPVASAAVRIPGTPDALAPINVDAMVRDTGDGFALATERLGGLHIALDPGDLALRVHVTAERSATASLIAAQTDRLQAAVETGGQRLAALSVDVRDGDGGRRALPWQQPSGSPRRAVAPAVPAARSPDRFA